MRRGGIRGGPIVLVQAGAALVLCLWLWLQGAVAADLALLLMLVALSAAAASTAAARRLGLIASLLPAGLALNLTGLLMLALIAPGFARLQALWSLAGLGVYFGLALRSPGIDGRRDWSLGLIAGALALVLLTFAVGTHPSGPGPRQWLAVGPVYFQPSELLKLALVLHLAVHLGRRQPRPGRWLPVMAVSVGVLVLQGDLGAAAVTALVAGIMLYGATGYWQLPAAGVLLLAGGTLAAHTWVPHATDRLTTWLNPWSDPYGASFQVLQSLRAIAEGGLAGKGLLTDAGLYIPAAHTDMILPVVGERLGLAGSLAIVAFYWAILGRVKQAGAGAASRPGSLLALGVAAAIVGQAILIMAGSTALLPLTGVTLPFVSYGGSSLLLSYAALGLVEGQRRHADGGHQDRPQRVVYLCLAGGVACLGVWLGVWHAYGGVILARAQSGL